MTTGGRRGPCLRRWGNGRIGGRTWMGHGVEKEVAGDRRKFPARIHHELAHLVRQSYGMLFKVVL